MEEGFKARNRVFEKLMDIENNKVNWERLCCANKPLVPFMGAGTSAWCYPMWNQLLENIVEETYSKKCAEIVKTALECSKNDSKKEDSNDAKEFPWMEEIAECIFNSDRKSYRTGKKKFYISEDNEKEYEALMNLRNYIGEEWVGKKLEAEQALYRTFNPELLKEKGTRPEYQNYFPILFQDILVTTNYDKALEYCYPSILSYSYNDLNLDTKKQKKSWLFRAVNGKLARMNDKLRKKESGLPSVTIPEMPMLLKVHGSIERASDIALTRDGYNKAYCSELIQLLRIIFQKSTLLFVGCSLWKDRITDELKKLKEEKDENICHFAFLPLNREGEKRNLDQYGIYPIYYEADVLDELIGNPEERKKIFHDYCLGVLFENLVRRKKGYSQPQELLWEKNRYRQEKTISEKPDYSCSSDQPSTECEESEKMQIRMQKRSYRDSLRKQMLEQRELQYVRRVEAMQIWEMLNSSGECPLIAITGAPGSGKTTVASLIPRFWDAASGSVKIGGTDVRNLAQQDLMNKVAFVFQDTKLLKGSIFENIKAARPSATREEVLSAATEAQCDDILEKFPEGIDTIIGTKGVYLSGGEQQRIALARAILKDAPIVLLDEATAFADPENEYKIQMAFEHLTRGKTVLMIAHRLSTVQNADCIYVLREGKIVEQGTHNSLLKRQGVYTQMWNDYQTSIEWNVGKGADSSC